MKCVLLRAVLFLGTPSTHVKEPFITNVWSFWFLKEDIFIQIFNKIVQQYSTKNYWLPYVRFALNKAHVSVSIRIRFTFIRQTKIPSYHPYIPQNSSQYAAHKSPMKFGTLAIVCFTVRIQSHMLPVWYTGKQFYMARTQSYSIKNYRSESVTLPSGSAKNL